MFGKLSRRSPQACWLELILVTDFSRIRNARRKSLLLQRSAILSGKRVLTLGPMVTGPVLGKGVKLANSRIAFLNERVHLLNAIRAAQNSIQQAACSKLQKNESREIGALLNKPRQKRAKHRDRERSLTHRHFRKCLLFRRILYSNYLDCN